MLQVFSEWRLTTLITLFFLLPATPVTGIAFQGGLEMSSGYDDNVTKTSDTEEGSGFINGRFQIQQEILQNATDLSMTVGMDGYYKEYFSMSEQYQAGGFSQINGRFFKNRCYPGIRLSWMLYRNGDVPSDDNDGFEADVHADFLVNGRLGIRIK